MDISYCYILVLREKSRTRINIKLNLIIRWIFNSDQESFSCYTQIFLTLNLPTYLNYYIYQSETIPLRSMYPIRPLFKQCSFGSSLSSSFQKEDLLSVLPTSLPGQSSNSNHNVGDDAGDSTALDSCISKYTKCTNQSQSSFLDENEAKYSVVSTPQKSQGKQLKKEMKKQKIKRKYQEKKNLNLINFQKVNFSSNSSPIKRSSVVQEQSRKKNLQNTFDKQSLDYKIQKLSQNVFVKSIPQKKIHTQNSSASLKIQLPYLSLLELDQVKIFLNKSQDLKSKQNLFLEQTRIIQQDVLQNSNYYNKSLGNYFIDDLLEELKQKCSKRIYEKKQTSFSKLSFVQNMIDHSVNYQLPIQNAKPKDFEIKKIELERRLEDSGKKTLLIDLDDTLIFTSKPMNAEQLDQNDLQISQNDGKVRKLYLRPHAKEFLSRMSRFYQIIIFTAATNCYAQQIRKILDPTNTIISHLLDRRFCFNPNLGSAESKLPFIKDLRRINRDLSQTLLLDNSIYCFWYQIHNGIPITSYNKENHNDQEILKVEQYLLNLIKEEDIRQKNKQYFKLEEYEQYIDAETLVEELYLSQQ